MKLERQRDKNMPRIVEGIVFLPLRLIPLRPLWRRQFEKGERQKIETEKRNTSPFSFAYLHHRHPSEAENSKSYSSSGSSSRVSFPCLCTLVGLSVSNTLTPGISIRSNFEPIGDRWKKKTMMKSILCTHIQQVLETTIPLTSTQQARGYGCAARSDICIYRWCAGAMSCVDIKN